MVDINTVVKGREMNSRKQCPNFSFGCWVRVRVRVRGNRLLGTADNNVQINGQSFRGAKTVDRREIYNI